MLLSVESSKRSYYITIKYNLLDEIENYLEVLDSYVLISDDLIPNEIITRITDKLTNCDVIRFPSGEQSKSLLEYNRLIETLIEKGITRQTKLIALGGGVTGDLVGFIASTVYRGIDYIQIPTSLLAMIDSSVGGKVGINTKYAKNSIGAIYPPIKVLIDPSTLSSLPVRHFNNGMAELIKYGMIASKPLFDSIKNININIDMSSYIYQALMIKKHFVESDEFDFGIRQTLNFGHTFGHAYESYYNYQKYLHGEAVALGMLIMTDESIRYDLEVVLKQFSLPIEDPLKPKDLLEYIKKDKKSKKSEINLVKVKEIGFACIEETRFDNLLTKEGLVK
jgi:3-dehydroquinate synthase